MNSNFYKICLLFFVVLFHQNCKRDCDSCDTATLPTSITSTVQMQKTNEKCSDIDLLFDISFGVSFEFEMEIGCSEHCDEQTIFYHRKLYRKTPNGVIDSSPNSIARAYYNCNSLTMFSQTLNTKVGDSMTYAIGDTIRYEFFDPRLCRSLDRTECSSDNIPLDISDFAFEYILAAEDFECD